MSKTPSLHREQDGGGVTPPMDLNRASRNLQQHDDATPEGDGEEEVEGEEEEDTALDFLADCSDELHAALMAIDPALYFTSIGPPPSPQPEPRGRHG